MNRSRALRAAVGLTLATAAAPAGAQPAAQPPAAQPPAAQAPASPSDVERRLEALERENARLRERLDALDEEQAYRGGQVDKLLPLSGRLTGYLDFGFFFVQGNGSGVRPDVGNERFPEHAAVSGPWVFYGDPLSTAINGRGEPADTGDSRAVVYDPVDNGGKASFVVNALNLALFAGLGDDLAVHASLDLVPRARNVSTSGDGALGDFLDLKLAYVEWIAPVESFDLSLFAGKIDSVLGVEYRALESPDRIGVTPSLLCRYTCGAPLGLKARARFWGEAVSANVALTNGSHGTENFPFHDEVDENHFKTVAARVAGRAPLGAGLEVGVSGAFGASDQQPDDALHHFHYGVDLHLDWNDLDLTAELLVGEFDGATEPARPACNLSPCLRYKGAYGQAGYRLLGWLMPYARVDWRDALHRKGGDFVYVSELMRVTGGSRFEIGANVIVKAEYTFILELGRAPSFPNDVLTSSMVVRY